MEDHAPELNPLLQLWPRRFEKQFWASDIYKAAEKTLDSWSRIGTLVTHLLFLRWQLQVNQHRSTMRVSRSVVMITVTICDMVWARFAPKSHAQRRNLIVWFYKTLMFVMACLIAPSTTRGFIRLDNGTALLTAATSSKWLTLPAPLDSLKALVVVSYIGFVLLSALIRPLPLLPQVALHSLYTLLLSLSHLRPATLILAPLAPALRPLCLSLNTYLLLFPGAASPSLPSMLLSLSSLCAANAIPLLILFTNLYFGLLLPSFLSYRLELHLKRRYLLSLALARNQKEEAEDLSGGLSLPQPMDYIAPPLLILPAWALTLWCYPLIARLSWAP